MNLLDNQIAYVERLPTEIKFEVVQKKYLDYIINLPETGTPFERLFDIFEEYLDPAAETDDWNCYKCREKVANFWRAVTPHLKEKYDSTANA